ncbi:MAG: L-glutamate gamma-semialdehyde dehydrogenase [Bacteroidales bacterium]|jgi:1-pyrroline-5-carboxylate dehydrogenase|nr:L-glutamate gamma-semialdehyde dehydrogenase [Bacteroidales bacterium]MBR4340981.1 L-glutamate gamma-semialdehyde dehydrogenase [Bacteroidales bacterium]MBR4512740.1 L-glutamate gamma-semialdehyde dehydrogenase [Bacteroidales bacterium]MBR6920540.1 L-glutamate gamma-semialdehyde dehydrogenase [Bacteroidales bacterium]
MNNASYIFREPKNEPVYSYAPGTPERAALKAELEKQYNQCIEIPLIIGGKDVKTGDMGTVVMPTEHKHVLAKYHKVGKKEVQMAIDAAMAAREKWESMPWIQRASIMMKAAELLATKYRYVLNAATMLGQGKSPMQAEIDCPCEAIDFLRFNTYFASKIYSEQPISDHTMLDRNEYRGMEGFVYAITPFNFTSIALNLNVAPALMGNVTIWKPSTTAILSNYYLMRLLQEAGLPDGVINFLPGSGSVISEVAFKSPYLAGIHFTGSTGTFKNFWKLIGQNIDIYKTYPKIVGETGGKDFIFAHKTAPARELAVAILRGAFEYQGQKCSAASRAYVPKSLWPKTLKHIQEMMKTVKMGDGRDFGNLINAVIDEKSFDNIAGYIDRAKKSPDAEIVLGGGYSKKVGYFVEPTIIVAKTPDYESMREEIFGPVITIYVYPDAQFEKTLKLCDETSPYALTGSIFATDRYAIEVAEQALRHAAGNFYINDKPTGAVVGCQPFGGARASGTNDKAGSALNLYRWISARCIKETFVPATDYGYPFLKEE